HVLHSEQRGFGRAAAGRIRAPWLEAGNVLTGEELKLGAENPKKVAMMALLLLAAVFLLFRTLNTPDPQASTASGQPAPRPTPEQRRAQGAGNTQLASNLDPTLRFALLRPSKETPYKGSGRNISKPQAEPPPVIPKPVVPAITQPIGPPK